MWELSMEINYIALPRQVAIFHLQILNSVYLVFIIH